MVPDGIKHDKCKMSDSEKIIYEINLGGSTVVTVFNGDGEEVPFLPQELEQLFFR